MFGKWSKCHSYSVLVTSSDAFIKRSLSFIKRPIWTILESLRSKYNCKTSLNILEVKYLRLELQCLRRKRIILLLPNTKMFFQKLIVFTVVSSLRLSFHLHYTLQIRVVTDRLFSNRLLPLCYGLRRANS